MSNSYPLKGHTGIVSCNDLSDAYCIRKMIEIFTSAVIIILAVITLINIIRRQKLRQYSWLAVLIIIIICCLIINILFCIFNDHYWLYAIQTYFYNLYYLCLVGYVAKSYLLKYRQIKNLKKFLLDPQNQKRKDKERTIFYSIFITIAAIYTAILISSLILQILEEINQSELAFCQEIWYLCFEGGCLLLSFIVLLTLYKNQIEEEGKLCEYQGKVQKREGILLTKQQKNNHQNLKNSKQKINNPLKSLWIWISFNVAGQLFNLIQSILFSLASPPSCLIVKNNYTGSNVLEIIFVLLSMYLCYAITLYYVAKRSSGWHKHIINTQFFNQMETDRVIGIELYTPTNNQTPSNSAQ